MNTTQQWLHEVKTVPGKLQQWLERQYVGEALAAQRIQQLAETQTGKRPEHVLLRIMRDEQKHTAWIYGLLLSRDIPIPEVTLDGTRYWEPILENLHTFEEIAGAGHHAETMRLARIRALAEDAEIDDDIREVFRNILPDEEFHAKAFASLSTPEDIEKVRPLHEAGLDLLGLVI